MANTTRINCTQSKYGNSNYKSYAYSGSIYAATYTSTGTKYASRLQFPSVRSIEAIGSANIAVSEIKLHIRRDSGGPASVTAGSAESGAWGAETDASGTATIAASTKWYEIDITDCAAAMLEYSGTWYLHLTGSGTRVRCNGAGTDWTPYITIVWDDAASTITSDATAVTLGESVSFEIAPEAGDAFFGLSYSFGDASGEIGLTGSTQITWTPPIELASEIPNAESGEAKILMRVYDASGALLRTEALYITLEVPESVKPAFQDDTFSVYSVNGLSYGTYSAALQGKSKLGIKPTVDLSGAYGATIRTLVAALESGGTAQTLKWSDFSETDDDLYTGATLRSNTFENAGTVKITLTLTDSRGRQTTATRSINVHEYAEPKIAEFSVERYEAIQDDSGAISGYEESATGEKVRVTLKASCTGVTAGGAARNFLSWQITAVDSNGKTTVYSGCGDATEVAIDQDVTVITADIPTALAVEYTAQVTDTAGYTAYQYDSVVQGRANFALSGSKYGASFGCLPSGTEEKPMLESAYPFYPYGGIEGVTNYTTEEVTTGGTWIDGKPIYRKIISVTATAVSTWAVSSGDNAIQNVDTIVKYELIADVDRIINSSEFYSTSAYVRAYIQRQSDGLVIAYWTNDKSQLGTARAIVYYTKTSD